MTTYLVNNLLYDKMNCRRRNCDTNLTSNTPANQYQRLKLIQNTVRVASSLYTMNLGSLNTYVKPTNITHGVNWNQMSDRPFPSVQKATIPTGFHNSLNNRHNSVTSSRPGCQTPGGIGCDIKHNSYDRYLNRLKAKGPLRRGVIPPTFGQPFIPFNCAFPIYGGKTIKTSIVSGCNCPINGDSNSKQIYNNPFYQEYPEADYTFKIGQLVYVIKNNNKFYSKATIIGINNDQTYDVQFVDDSTIQKNVLYILIKLYNNCDCNGNDKII